MRGVGLWLVVPRESWLIVPRTAPNCNTCCSRSIRACETGIACKGWLTLGLLSDFEEKL